MQSACMVTVVICAGEMASVAGDSWDACNCIDAQYEEERVGVVTSAVPQRQRLQTLEAAPQRGDASTRYVRNFKAVTETQVENMLCLAIM